MRDYIVGLDGAAHDLLAKDRVQAWEAAIRTTCETLVDASAMAIHAASLTIGSDAEGEIALVCGLVDEAAEHYGLDAALKLGRRSVTVRFTRRAARGTLAPIDRV